MVYKPFTVLDMKAGKVSQRDPWLLPGEAFEPMSNCHLKRGVFEKRMGYSFLEQMIVVNTISGDPSVLDIPIMGIKNYLSGGTENLVVFSKTLMNKFVAGAITGINISAITDAGGGLANVETATAHGFLTNDIVKHEGTSVYDTVWKVTKVDATNYTIKLYISDETGGTTSQTKLLDVSKNKIRYVGKVGQNYTPAVSDTIKGGISNATGVVSALILDTGTVVGEDARGTILFTNGGVTGTFQDNEELQENGTAANIAGQSDGANSNDYFTGDNTQYYQVANWNDVMYIVNGNDPIQKYDGTNLSRLVIDIGDVNDENNVNNALLVFIYKERLLLLRTNEDGVDYLQRARWSTIKNPQSWPTANFKDAPTAEVIVTAGFLGDDLYVWFENSVYRLAWTGNATDPFEWIKVSSTQGAVATNSIVNTPIQDLETQIAVGPNRIQANDRRNIVGIDKKIPDFVLDWVQDSLPFSNSILLAEERQTIISYASSGAVANDDGNIYPDSALILNYEDLSWATQTLPIHTMGLTTLESDVTWDTDSAWADIDSPWNALNTQSGFPLTLMGSQDGKVYQLNSTLNDDGAAIEFSAKTARMNPFTEQGHKAKLGYIMFLVDVDVNASFDVNSFINTVNTAFQTKTVSCTAVDGSDDKAWHRVDVFATANFHRIELTNNAVSNRPRIHAITLYFQDAGGDLNG